MSRKIYAGWILVLEAQNSSSPLILHDEKVKDDIRAGVEFYNSLNNDRSLYFISSVNNSLTVEIDFFSPKYIDKEIDARILRQFIQYLFHNKDWKQKYFESNNPNVSVFSLSSKRKLITKEIELNIDGLDKQTTYNTIDNMEIFINERAHKIYNSKQKHIENLISDSDVINGVSALLWHINQYDDNLYEKEILLNIKYHLYLWMNAKNKNNENG